MACVYIFRHGKENKFKIGHTKKSAKVRLKELQTGNPDLTIHYVIETEYDTEVEKYIHRRLATKKIINGSSSDEFYAISPAELQPSIAEANDYNREYLPMIKQAKDLGAEKPDGSIKEPGNAALAMHQELLEIEEEKARLPSTPASRNPVHHGAIPEHRQIEAVTVEGDKLGKQFANLFHEIAYQLRLGTLANVGCPSASMRQPSGWRLAIRAPRQALIAASSRLLHLASPAN